MREVIFPITGSRSELQINLAGREPGMFTRNFAMDQAAQMAGDRIGSVPKK